MLLKELSLIPSVCEVPQAVHIKKNYKGRIDKLPNNIKHTFTLVNMAKAYYEFDSILHECKDLPYGRCITLPTYRLLCNPCYLLIAYSSLSTLSAQYLNLLQMATNVKFASIIGK